MKKLLIILFFASVLIYAKAEALTFFVYSEVNDFDLVDTVERAFMRAVHRIANSEEDYLDYYALVAVTTETKNQSFLFLKWDNVEVELQITIIDPRKKYSIARESDKGKGDNIDELAYKVVKKIDKVLKKTRN